MAVLVSGAAASCGASPDASLESGGTGATTGSLEAQSSGDQPQADGGTVTQGEASSAGAASSAGVTSVRLEYAPAPEQPAAVPSGNVERTTSALLPGVQGPLNWTSYDGGRKQLFPASSHFCHLSKVTGSFRGGGETVRVYNDSSGWWWLGDSGVQWISASAYCHPLRLFTGPAPTSIWTSGEAWGWAQTGTTWSPMTGTVVLPNWTNVGLWWGDAASVLSGMRGEFNGYGEWVGISQSPDPFAGSTLTARTGATFIQGFAHSFFVGVPSAGRPARFIGPAVGWGDVSGDASAAVEYAVNGAGMTFMARTDQAMCYFTNISGKFAGGGEYAEISTAYDAQGYQRWVLRTGSMQTGINARARCFRYNQNI